MSKFEVDWKGHSSVLYTCTFFCCYAIVYSTSVNTGDSGTEGRIHSAILRLWLQVQPTSGNQECHLKRDRLQNTLGPLWSDGHKPGELPLLPYLIFINNLFRASWKTPSIEWGSTQLLAGTFLHMSPFPTGPKNWTALIDQQPWTSINQFWLGSVPQ